MSSGLVDTATSAPQRLGRPTKEQSDQRRDALLDIALDHFLQKGFEQATIDAITASANMSKRTVYKFYPDKASLFLSAVRRAVDQAVIPDSQLDAIRMHHLESTLLAVAFLRVRLLTSPEGMRLQKIIQSEAIRFPEIVVDAYDRTQRPLTTFVADQIRRHARAGSLAHEQSEKAANAFFSLALSATTRLLTFGAQLDEREIEQNITFGVRLFLEGVALDKQAEV